MKFIIRSLFGLFLVGFLVVGTLGVGGCGSSTVANNNEVTTDCASGDNDFYVVENASCEADAGKLSRINPDEPCKEVILPGLDCPVDFVMSSDGVTGYLSERTTSTSTSKGNIYSVDVSTGIKTLMNDGVNRSFNSPAGLALMEDLNQTERDAFCGGNTLDPAALLVADEGDDSESDDADGGTLWIWCLYTDDFSESLTPIAVISAGSEPIENFRGVAILNRDTSNPDETTIIVTGDAVDDSSSVVVSKALTSNSAAGIVDGSSFTDLKDITIDSDGRPMVADNGGDGTIALLRIDAGEFDSLSQVGSPRDILTASDGSFLFTDFDAGTVSRFSSINDEDATVVTEGLELDGPDGIAR